MFKLKSNNDSKKVTPIKINWKLFFVSFLALNVGSLLLMLLYAFITGARYLDDNMFMAITIVQIMTFYLTGLLMGYWAGGWPRWEMVFIFITSVQSSFNKNLKAGLNLESLIMMIICLALYGGSFLGGGISGIKLKKKKKQKSQIATESEVSHHD